MGRNFLFVLLRDVKGSGAVPSNKIGPLAVDPITIREEMPTFKFDAVIADYGASEAVALALAQSVEHLTKKPHSDGPPQALDEIREHLLPL
jgi:hypothetical protein